MTWNAEQFWLAVLGSPIAIGLAYSIWCVFKRPKDADKDMKPDDYRRYSGM